MYITFCIMHHNKHSIYTFCMHHNNTNGGLLLITPYSQRHRESKLFDSVFSLVTNDLYSAFDMKALSSTKQCGKKKTLFNFIKSLNCYFNELGIQSGSCSPPTLCCQGGAELREAASLMGLRESAGHDVLQELRSLRPGSFSALHIKLQPSYHLIPLNL